MRLTRFLPFGLLICTQVTAQKATRMSYLEPSLPIAQRVQDLLGRMTIEEKVAQLEGNVDLPSIGTLTLPSVFTASGLNERMLRGFAGNGLGTYAFLKEFQSDPSVTIRLGAHQRNLIQTWVLNNTRLGIPVLFHGEALHGAVTRGATNFPAAVALGSTWDPALIESVFSAVAAESRAAGNVLVLAPVLDLSRDPRYGRVEEMYSEDPYLVAQLGVAAVRGLQGAPDRLDDRHVFATAKHFLHGQPENGTNIGPSDYSELTTRNIFFYPFEQVIKRAQIEAVMPSYNETGGGIPSAANPWLLKDVLRGEWGFTGLTVSDYGAVEQLATIHHVSTGPSAAGLLAFRSGVDMELPAASGFPALVAAVKTGKVSNTDLDAAVGRVLSAKFRAGLFEHPLVDEDRAEREVDTAENRKLALKVAEEAVVLLQNKGNLLPLTSAHIKTLAVIGPAGDKVRLGGYSGLPNAPVSLVEGLKRRLGATVQVVSAEGCKISEPDLAPNLNTFTPFQAPSAETDAMLLQEALQTASSADVVVLALGANEAISRESLGNVGLPKPILGDSDTLELPGRQMELVHAIAKLGKPMVAVLQNGRAYAIGDLLMEVPAVVQGWYLGEEGGTALAEVLFGDVNPSGHLPVTVAKNVGQLPVYYYKTPAARRGYVADDNSPLFPFGFGLSYTTFAFSKPVLDQDRIPSNGSAKVSVQVTNTGKLTGDQVVQLYVHHLDSTVAQPVLALKNFRRVRLEPGASTTVTFAIGAEQLSIMNSRMKRVVEPGRVDVLIGSDSASTSAIRLIVIE